MVEEEGELRMQLEWGGSSAIEGGRAQEACKQGGGKGRHTLQAKGGREGGHKKKEGQGITGGSVIVIR